MRITIAILASRAEAAGELAAQAGREAWCAALTEVVWAKIVEGGSLRSIGHEPGMPTRHTLGRWVKTQPAFARRVAEGCVYREDWYRDQIDVIEEAMAPGMSVRELKAIRARAAPFRAQLGRLQDRPGVAKPRR